MLQHIGSCNGWTEVCPITHVYIGGYLLSRYVPLGHSINEFARLGNLSELQSLLKTGRRQAMITSLLESSW